MFHARKTIVALAVVLWMVPGGALAGEEQRGEIGALGGVSYSDKELTGDEETGVSFGVRASYLYSRDRDWGVFGDVLLQSFDSTAPSFSSLSSIPASGMRVRSDEDVDTLTLRAGIEHLFNPESRRRWFIAFGGGWMEVDAEDLVATPGGLSTDTIDGDFDRPFASVSGGQRFYIGRSMEWRWEVRADQTFTLQSEGSDGLDGENFLQARALAGITWGLGKRKDTDGDGVPDGLDNCPDTQRGAIVDSVGCALDGDKDGVPDGIDTCADTPMGATVDAVGCPSDSDEDGVLDGLDRCADTPTGATVDSSGCPKDQDGDAVFDGLDKCADTPQGASVDAEGCPNDPDEDGVLDGIDKCADTPKGATVDAVGCPSDEDSDDVFDGLDQCPGTLLGMPVDETGCAEAIEGISETMSTVVLEGIQFESDSAVLAGDSTVVLERTARSLRDHPELRVEVAGHTDSSGAAAHNKRLSVERAESVRDYLVGRGIDAGRLEVKGYGEENPIADNDTVEGKDKNRRVELSKVE